MVLSALSVQNVPDELKASKEHSYQGLPHPQSVMILIRFLRIYIQTRCVNSKIKRPDQ